jgi:hypothetical protein
MKATIYHSNEYKVRHETADYYLISRKRETNKGLFKINKEQFKKE